MQRFVCLRPKAQAQSLSLLAADLEFSQKHLLQQIFLRLVRRRYCTNTSPASSWDAASRALDIPNILSLRRGSSRCPSLRRGSIRCSSLRRGNIRCSPRPPGICIVVRYNNRLGQNLGYRGILRRTVFFFASAGPKVGPVCSDRSGTLRGFTAWLIYDWNPRCSVSGNTRNLAVQRSVIHPNQGV